jgi:HJR/Mrr/RecB family endonuclease
MRRNAQKLFDSLRDRTRALNDKVIPSRDGLSPIYSIILGVPLPSNFPKGTVGYFADQLRKSPDSLISLLEEMGVSSVTPEHLFDTASKERLLAYLRAKRAPEAKTAFNDNSPIESKLIIVHEINDRLLNQLAAEPKLLHSLHPRAFEELVARILKDQGCDVTLTKSTRDGGYDVLGHYRSSVIDVVFFAECKRYAPENRVGVEVIRGLYGVTEAHHANLGLVITTSTFTKDAREEKLRIGPRIDLKEFNDLCNWLAPYKKPS